MPLQTLCASSTAGWKQLQPLAGDRGLLGGASASDSASASDASEPSGRAGEDAAWGASGQSAASRSPLACRAAATQSSSNRDRKDATVPRPFLATTKTRWTEPSSSHCNVVAGARPAASPALLPRLPLEGLSARARPAAVTTTSANAGRAAAAAGALLLGTSSQLLLPQSPVLRLPQLLGARALQVAAAWESSESGSSEAIQISCSSSSSSSSERVAASAAKDRPRFASSAWAMRSRSSCAGSVAIFGGGREGGVGVRVRSGWEAAEGRRQGCQASPAAEVATRGVKHRGTRALPLLPALLPGPNQWHGLQEQVGNWVVGHIPVCAGLSLHPPVPRRCRRRDIAHTATGKNLKRRLNPPVCHYPTSSSSKVRLPASWHRCRAWTRKRRMCCGQGRTSGLARRSTACAINLNKRTGNYYRAESTAKGFQAENRGPRAGDVNRQ